MSSAEIAERLEMLLVARWLEGGRPPDGVVALSLVEAVDELELEGGREGILRLMSALGELENRGVVDVSWPGGVGSQRVDLTLADDLRRDAGRLFGG